ncbi:cupin domain-containing protein [Candidatus Nomurabacteria bacterium]|nr:cupin domain-containing protein [Candidatus Nomurabacteria bacterium]
MKNNQIRKPFRKNLSEIPVEEAHGGSGKRKLILSREDPISNQLQAMTKGFLAANGYFDWHEHENIDEFFLVIKGTGVVEFEDGTTIEYQTEDIVYMPSNIKHKMTAKKESEFLFIRLND